MDDQTFARVGAISAAVVGALSLLYAIAYLGITPADQRGSDIDKFFRSYLAHPTGLRLAALCLLVSGLISGAAIIALIGRLDRGRTSRSLSWAGSLAVLAGFATAAHGLGDLVGVDKLAHRYAAGDAATKAAVAVAHVSPSAIDPRGLATFAASGIVALVVGLALRSVNASPTPSASTPSSSLPAAWQAWSSGRSGGYPFPECCGRPRPPLSPRRHWRRRRARRPRRWRLIRASARNSVQSSTSGGTTLHTNRIVLGPVPK